MLLVISALAVYALQPALPVRGLDFWLPTATLGLTVLGWILTTPREQRAWNTNWPAAVILGGIVLALGLTRFLGFSLPADGLTSASNYSDPGCPGNRRP